MMISRTTSGIPNHGQSKAAIDRLSRVILTPHPIQGHPNMKKSPCFLGWPADKLDHVDANAKKEKQ